MNIDVKRHETDRIGEQTIREELLEFAGRILGARVSDVHREPGYLLHHGRRVAALAEYLYMQCSGEGDDDYGVSDYAGALFHDVGKGYPDHHTHGAMIVGPLLADFAGRIDIDRVVEIVGNHCLREPGKTEPLHIAVVQDADLIDHYGAQGVWIGLQRTARTNGDQASIIAERLAEDVERRIDKYRRMVNLDLSLELFDERVEFERSFYIRLKSEYGEF